jgi:hypothetical protein
VFQRPMQKGDDRNHDHHDKQRNTPVHSTHKKGRTALAALASKIRPASGG